MAKTVTGHYTGDWGIDIRLHLGPFSGGANKIGIGLAKFRHFLRVTASGKVKCNVTCHCWCQHFNECRQRWYWENWQEKYSLTTTVTIKNIPVKEFYIGVGVTHSLATPYNWASTALALLNLLASILEKYPELRDKLNKFLEKVPLTEMCRVFFQMLKLLGLWRPCRGGAVSVI